MPLNLAIVKYHLIFLFFVRDLHEVTGNYMLEIDNKNGKVIPKQQSFVIKR